MLLAVDPCPSIGQGPTDRCDGPRTDLFRLGERGREDAISRGTEMHTGGTTGRVCNDRPPNYGNLLLRYVLETPRRVDPDLAAEVAVRFQSAPNDQTNATIRAAYEQLERQSDLLFAHLTDPDRPRHRRLRVEFTQCDNPYDSDDELVGAVRTHGVLEITTSARDRDRRHPLLGCDFGGTYDRFRAVHDIVAHVGPRLGFDRNGEFAAWLTRERLYHGLAPWPPSSPRSTACYGRPQRFPTIGQPLSPVIYSTGFGAHEPPLFINCAVWWCVLQKDFEVGRTGPCSRAFGGAADDADEDTRAKSRKKRKGIMNMDRAAKDTNAAMVSPRVETATEETGDGRRRVAIYHAWSKVAETTAPLEVIENRYPALFETRRILYPRLAEFADPKRYDQGIGGFLDNIQLARFAEFGEFATKVTGAPSTKNERVNSQGVRTPITGELLSGVDTFVVISLDVVRTGQQASEDEIAALRDFLDVADNLLVVAPHHSIGDYPEKEFLHHGDRTTPPEQRFSGFARSILAGLDVPVDNRFGLRGAILHDGNPAPIECDPDLDRLGLLEGVTTFNSHPHLPHLERCGAAIEKLDVLAGQRVDPNAPAHPFTANGRATFDSLLQSRPGVFKGDLLVGDATLFQSTWGGLESLTRLWTNLVTRTLPASWSTVGPNIASLATAIHAKR